MTRINWIFCSNLSKIDFHLKYNVVWTNCNVQFDFFGNSNSLNFSLNDSKWWKCKLFIIFLLWGSRYFSIFLNYHSAQPQLNKTCDMVVSTEAVTTKRALSPVVYNATISPDWYRWWNDWSNKLIFRGLLLSVHVFCNQSSLEIENHCSKHTTNVWSIKIWTTHNLSLWFG